MKYAILVVTFFMATLLGAESSFAQELTPDEAPRLAEIAVTVFQKIDEPRLDYSPESLKAIDRIVLKFRSEGDSVESVTKSLTVLGCYVGEVMVRNLGYKWDIPTGKERSVGLTRLGVRGSGLFFNPIGKVFNLMANGEGDSVVVFYDFAAHPPKDLTKDLK